MQQADFQELQEKQPRLSTTELASAAASRKNDRAKYIAAKSLQEEAVSWGGQIDDGTGRRIVVLRHMFSLEETEGEEQFYTDLAEEVREEPSRVIVHTNHLRRPSFLSPTPIPLACLVLPLHFSSFIPSLAPISIYFCRVVLSLSVSWSQKQLEKGGNVRLKMFHNFHGVLLRRDFHFVVHLYP